MSNTAARPGGGSQTGSDAKLVGAAPQSGASAQNAVVRPDGSAARVLVVDDEVVLADLLAAALRHEGWEVAEAHSGSQAVRVARDFQPDVVVLDIMLPDFDGYEVLARLHRDRPQLPVLFLTAKDAVAERVSGLSAGADDYVTKPFSLDEVAARIQVLLRRAGLVSAQDDTILEFGDLVMNVSSHEVWRDGEPITLTATEFDLLLYLMENPRRALSKGQILEHVWGYDFGGQANVVELYISYLRRKIDAGRLPLIHTLRGVGYILKADGDR